MFRKPGTVNSAPKIEPKYESKYKLKEEPKFEIKCEPKVKPSTSSSTKRKLIAEQATVSRFKREGLIDQEVNVYIKGLDLKISDTKLYKLFSHFGTITTNKVII